MYLGISLFVRPFVSSHGLMFVYSFVFVCLFVETSAHTDWATESDRWWSWVLVPFWVKRHFWIVVDKRNVKAVRHLIVYKHFMFACLLLLLLLFSHWTQRMWLWPIKPCGFPRTAAFWVLRSRTIPTSVGSLTCGTVPARQPTQTCAKSPTRNPARLTPSWKSSWSTWTSSPPTQVRSLIRRSYLYRRSSWTSKFWLFCGDTLLFDSSWYVKQ